MANFNLNWIVFEVKKLNEKNISIKLFTKEYWKIQVFTKQNSKKNIDLWNIINCEINVWKNNVVKNYSNIKIISQFDYLQKDYISTFEYLNTLNILNKLIPLNQEIPGIYEIIYELNNYSNISEHKILLCQLKILNTLWLLSLEVHNIIIQKILNFINKNKIQNILKLKLLDSSINTQIKTIISSHY